MNESIITAPAELEPHRHGDRRVRVTTKGGVARVVRKGPDGYLVGYESGAGFIGLDYEQAEALALGMAYFDGPAPTTPDLRQEVARLEALIAQTLTYVQDRGMTAALHNKARLEAAERLSPTGFVRGLVENQAETDAVLAAVMWRVRDLLTGQDGVILPHAHPQTPTGRDAAGPGRPGHGLASPAAGTDGAASGDGGGGAGAGAGEPGGEGDGRESAGACAEADADPAVDVWGLPAISGPIPWARFITKLPSVRPEFVEESLYMRSPELRRRMLIGSDWVGLFHKCLDGLGLNNAPDGCWEPRMIRGQVEWLMQRAGIKPPTPGAAVVEVPVQHHCTACDWETTALYTPRMCRECGQNGMEPKS